MAMTLGAARKVVTKFVGIFGKRVCAKPIPAAVVKEAEGRGFTLGKTVLPKMTPEQAKLTRMYGTYVKEENGVRRLLYAPSEKATVEATYSLENGENLARKVRLADGRTMTTTVDPCSGGMHRKTVFDLGNGRMKEVTTHIDGTSSTFDKDGKEKLSGLKMFTDATYTDEKLGQYLSQQTKFEYDIHGMRGTWGTPNPIIKEKSIKRTAGIFPMPPKSKAMTATQRLDGTAELKPITVEEFDKDFPHSVFR